MLYASKLGESGESLRNSTGRYPRGARSLFRTAKGESKPVLVDSKMQNWYTVPRFLILRSSFIPSRSMKHGFRDKYAYGQVCKLKAYAKKS